MDEIESTNKSKIKNERNDNLTNKKNKSYHEKKTEVGDGQSAWLVGVYQYYAVTLISIKSIRYSLKLIQGY